MERIGHGAHPTPVTATRTYLPIAAVGVIWATAALVATHTSHPPIAIAAAFDLTVTAGLAMWWLRGSFVWWPISGGLIIAKLVTHTTLPLISIALEVGTLALLYARRKTIARRVWPILGSELALLAHLGTGWRAPRGGAFTMHRANGWPLFAGVLVVLTVVETAALHVALHSWILTILSLYGALWFVGDALALRHGGLFVRADHVELRLGVRWAARIPLDAVWTRGTTAEARASVLEPNAVVTASAPIELTGLFGRTQSARSIAVSIDDFDGFVAALHRRAE